jgi:hypothetical protein
MCLHALRTAAPAAANAVMVAAAAEVATVIVVAVVIVLVVVVQLLPLLQLLILLQQEQHHAFSADVSQLNTVVVHWPQPPLGRHKHGTVAAASAMRSEIQRLNGMIQEDEPENG